MICRNCGKEFEGQFCPYCGHDSSKPTKAEKASKRKESVDKAKEKMKPAADFVKKHKVLVIIVAAVLVAAIIVGTTLGVVLSNNFRVGKMNEIKIGMTKAEVEKKLGKPHEDEDSEWYYYSKNYKKLVDEAKKLTGEDEDVGDMSEDDFESALDDLESEMNRLEELEKEAEKLTHDEILIRFSSDKVYAVEMRKDFNDETRNKKREVKKARLSEKEVKRFTTLQTPVYGIVEYADGSYRNAPIAIKEQPNTETEGKQSVTWHDEWSDTDVTAEIKVVKNPDIYDGAKAGDLMVFVYQNADGTFRMEIEGEGSLKSMPTFSEFSSEQRKNNLTSVVIGNGVTSIGFQTFYGCSSLVSIEIPNGVTSIDSSAFGGCGSLETLTVAEGNAKYYSIENCIIERETKTLILGCKNSVIPTDGSVTRIGSYAFDGCGSLVSINIPDSVTSIDSGAFRGCSGLVSINIPGNVTSIDSSAFSNCGSLVSVAIPNSVTSIGDYAFKDTGIWNNAANNSVVYADKWAVGYKGTITNVTLRADTVGISSEAFRDCGSLVSINIPDNVTSIGNLAFNGCGSLVSIEISNSVTSIGSNAFSDCSSLKSIEIPNSVTSIGNYAFDGCSSLVSIVIPNSVTSIGSWAFFDCGSLTNVTYGGTKAKWKAIEKGSYWNSSTGDYTVTCTDGTLTKAESES